MMTLKSFVILVFIQFLPHFSTAQILIPMDDDGQSDHLKAYGLVYEAIALGYDCHWLLNYRGGSFAILNGDQEIIKKSLIKGVS